MPNLSIEVCFVQKCSLTDPALLNGRPKTLPLPIKQAQSCGIFYPQDLKDVRQDDFRDTRLRIFSGTANLPLAQVCASVHLVCSLYCQGFLVAMV